MNNINKEFVEAMYDSFGTDIVSRTDINTFTKENGYKDQGWLKSDQYKVSRGKYQLPINGKVAVSNNLEKEIVVPTKVDVNDKVETKAATTEPSFMSMLRSAEFVPSTLATWQCITIAVSNPDVLAV